MSRRSCSKRSEKDRLVAAFGLVAPKLLPVAHEVGKALAFHGSHGRQWSERQRRILAAVVLVKSCTREDAAISHWLMLMRNDVTEGDSPAWSDSAVFAAVCREYDDWCAEQAAERRPKFRVINGGA